MAGPPETVVPTALVGKTKTVGYAQVKAEQAAASVRASDRPTCRGASRAMGHDRAGSPGPEREETLGHY